MIGNQKDKCSILVMGVGGAGNNAVKHMCKTNIENVRLMAINTDVQALNECPLRREDLLVIGENLTKGHGAGAKPEIGFEAANESIDLIRDNLENVHMLFIFAGMGGGTGTGAAPVIAKVAKDMDILTIAIVTKPYSFEGKVRNENAIKGIKNLQEVCDAIIIIPNDKLAMMCSREATHYDSFKRGNELFENSVRAVVDIIMLPGEINLDFADVSSILKNSQRAHIGVGVGGGENRVINALQKAMNNDILDSKIVMAKGIIVYLSGAKQDLKSDEGRRVVEEVRKIAHPDANIIFGIGYDDLLKGEIKITLIASDFNEDNFKQMEKQDVDFKKFNTDNSNAKKENISFTIVNQSEVKAAEKEGAAGISKLDFLFPQNRNQNNNQFMEINEKYDKFRNVQSKSGSNHGSSTQEYKENTEASKRKLPEFLMKLKNNKK